MKSAATVVDQPIVPLEHAVSVDAEMKLSMQVFRRIRQWIREGRLKEGDMLPSERELAGLFGVSRVPVREALKVLEFEGVAEKRRGKGLFLRRVSINNLISNIDFVLMDNVHTLMELFEAREAIELQATFLAAQRRTEEDIAALEAAVDAVEKKLHTGEEILDASMNFHTVLVNASHNQALVAINLYLADWLRIAREAVFRQTSLHDEGLHSHKEILDFVRGGDSEAAVVKMKEHLDRSKRFIEKAIEREKLADGLCL